jgi:uncharacterized membrane protein (UPF0182 family)
MAAKSDPTDYGQRLVYAFPKQKLVLGPNQVSARINQDPTISPQITLWSQSGSRVIFGNLLVLPIKDSLLYVQPLYLQAEGTAIPQLTRVIVAYGERVAMEADLAGALQKAFGFKPPGVEQTAGGSTAGTGTPTPTGPTTTAQDLATAKDLYQRALQAQRNGDWATYGKLIGELGTVLDRLATQSKTATPTP